MASCCPWQCRWRRKKEGPSSPSAEDRRSSFTTYPDSPPSFGNSRGRSPHSRVHWGGPLVSNGGSTSRGRPSNGQAGRHSSREVSSKRQSSRNWGRSPDSKGHGLEPSVSDEVSTLRAQRSHRQAGRHISREEGASKRQSSMNRGRSPHSKGHGLELLVSDEGSTSRAQRSHRGRSPQSNLHGLEPSVSDGGSTSRGERSDGRAGRHTSRQDVTSNRPSSMNRPVPVSPRTTMFDYYPSKSASPRPARRTPGKTARQSVKPGEDRKLKVASVDYTAEWVDSTAELVYQNKRGTDDHLSPRGAIRPDRRVEYARFLIPVGGIQPDRNYAHDHPLPAPVPPVPSPQHPLYVSNPIVPVGYHPEYSQQSVYRERSPRVTPLSLNVPPRVPTPLFPVPPPQFPSFSSPLPGPYSPRLGSPFAPRTRSPRRSSRRPVSYSPRLGSPLPSPPRPPLLSSPPLVPYFVRFESPLVSPPPSPWRSSQRPVPYPPRLGSPLPSPPRPPLLSSPRLVPNSPRLGSPHPSPPRSPLPSPLPVAYSPRLGSSLPSPAPSPWFSSLCPVDFTPTSPLRVPPPSTHSTPPKSPSRAPKVPVKWAKVRQIGSGSFGTVHEAINLDDGSFFAVKISNGETITPELQKEIEVLSYLKHPNVVQYYGTGQEDGRVCIFLELMQNSLRAIISHVEFFDESLISVYTRQILQGLEYLHKKNTIHRDIKCANILVDKDGQVKLADFGLAKEVGEDLATSCKGTPYFMAPEILKAGKNCKVGYGVPADIWSLGCTVIEMADGKAPWSGKEGFYWVPKVKNGELPPIPPHLSHACVDFIRSCLRLNPRDRPTASELLCHPFVANAPASVVSLEIVAGSLPTHDLRESFSPAPFLRNERHSDEAPSRCSEGSPRIVEEPQSLPTPDPRPRLQQFHGSERTVSRSHSHPCIDAREVEDAVHSPQAPPPTKDMNSGEPNEGYVRWRSYLFPDDDD